MLLDGAPAGYADQGVLALQGLSRGPHTLQAQVLDADGRVLHEMHGHQDTVTCLAYSPDGRWLVTGGDDRTVRLWDATRGEQAAAWELDNPVRALAFTPDGRQVFTGNGNTSCYQIDVDLLLATGT